MRSDAESLRGDEDELLDRVRNGDDAALEEIWQDALEGVHTRAFSLLVVLLCEGNRSAFDHVAHLLRPVLEEFARRLLRGRDRAPYGMSDLVQSGLQRAFVNASFLEVRTGRGFLAWMKQVLKNRFQDVEKQRRRRIAEAGGGSQEQSESADDHQAVGGATSAPGLEITHREEVSKLLSKLKEDDQKIFYLRAVVGLEHQEIADRLNDRGFRTREGKSYNADYVGVRFRRARARLRDELQGREAE